MPAMSSGSNSRERSSPNDVQRCSLIKRLSHLTPRLHCGIGDESGRRRCCTDRSCSCRLGRCRPSRPFCISSFHRNYPPYRCHCNPRASVDRGLDSRPNVRLTGHGYWRVNDFPSAHIARGRAGIRCCGNLRPTIDAHPASPTIGASRERIAR